MTTPIDTLLELAEDLRSVEAGLRALATTLGSEDKTGLVWDRGIQAELARNPGPYRSAVLNASGGWWQRSIAEIDGVTFHHTLSHSPHATASRYVKKDGGRPSIPYTLWVTQTGEVLLCNDLGEGCWHDHTGHRNTHLSVGLAGLLHINYPPEVQTAAAARVAVWALDTLSGVQTIDQIKGHKDYTATVCPGWSSRQSGYWRNVLYDKIAALLTKPELRC